ncbi:hypothetical protein KK101_00790 [Curtobacterium flaccumfaciens pv. oortii]|uniref:hypothetical protein n=1 Tax=Curtobacterium flaccumfaciens TaxID=2035 RepID=UPI001BDDDAED|nr:hypothetical protein [Curtobacterium flaccumfaciens]MBT1621227.1 hypothetical protein [Curtobacterium flaccumfaciens pv. oortii]
MTELEKLREAVEALNHSPGWDWNSFVSTLIATLVGAAAAGAVTIWVLRKQRRDEYEQTIRAASVRCVEATLRLMEARDGSDSVRARLALTAELHLLSGVMDNDDSRFARALIRLVTELGRSRAPAPVGHLVGTISASIAEFLSRRTTTEVHIDRLAEAREVLKKLIVEAEADAE